MAILLGIDTGGTYTDAVLHDEDAPAPGIISKAKALTTRQDLSIGIGGALDAVLLALPDGAHIGLVSISTTLATNALVEGQGGRICLILIGFEEQALSRAGLAEALGADPVVFIPGGHTPSGSRQAPLDRDALRDAIQRHAPKVDAFAVVAYFGSRDPEDERAAREMIGDLCARPVTCGHELSANLNGPKRALTAVLNARLIGMISDLIAATETILAARDISAPLMLVRGDGSLVSAAFARTRPIETILSGPAASLVGAAHLVEVEDAVVSDIGGTTTDIAILRAGRPALSLEGARVGGHHTMVEAVDMITHGLGGDSEVRLDQSALTPALHLGPRRLVPVSLLAKEAPDIVHRALDEDLARPIPGEHDGRFLFRRSNAQVIAGLRATDLTLLEDLDTTPRPARAVLTSRPRHAALSRLVAQGLVQVSGFTPSDAAHVTGRYTSWDREAARKAAALLARQRAANGQPVAADALAISELTLDTLQRRSAEVVLDAALRQDGHAQPGLTDHPLIQSALCGHKGAARVEIGLALPLIGLGASAPLYYPDIAAILGTPALIPEHADVANAVGAVVGRVRIAREVLVTCPSEGRFQVHLPDGPRDLPSEDQACSIALVAARDAARAAATDAGAADVEISDNWTSKDATIEGKRMLIEATARAVATGRPRIT